MSLPNLRRPTHGGTTIIPVVGEMSLPNLRRPTRGGIAIICGINEKELSSSRILLMAA
jgi:hypothetical protein